MPVPVMTIDGGVIAVASHWTDDGSRIVTEATVRTAGGDVVVNQMGGTVDGIGMVQMPGPTILAPGMRVAGAAHKGMDELAQEHVVLDSERGLDYLPGFVRTTGMTRHHPLYWGPGCASVTIDA